MAKKYLNEGDSPEHDLAEAIYPYAKIAMLIFTLGRVILLLVSIKQLSVCRYYLYYELLLFIINICLPQGLSFDVTNEKMMMFAVLNFTIYYFEWWPSLIT